MTSGPLHRTLTAGVVTTVTVDAPSWGQWDVAVLNRTGTADVWVTLDGTDPVPGGDGVHVVPAAVAAVVVPAGADPRVEVRLLCSAGQGVTVQAVDR